MNLSRKGLADLTALANNLFGRSFEASKLRVMYQSLRSLPPRKGHDNDKQGHSQQYVSMPDPIEDTSTSVSHTATFIFPIGPSALLP